MHGKSKLKHCRYVQLIRTSSFSDCAVLVCLAVLRNKRHDNRPRSMFRRAGRDLGLIHQVEAGWSLGGTLAPASSRQREKIEKFSPLILLFLVTFRYFVSEMVLTCTVSICIICKYGNGEIFTQSEEENGSRHL